MRLVRFSCVAVISVALSGCNPFSALSCSPNGCPKAEDGKGRLQPVIDALAAYSTAEGEYPDSVDVLTPSYLAELPRKPDWGPDAWWSYRRSEHGYSLRFDYGGPGFNSCFYSPTSSSWNCYGRY